MFPSCAVGKPGSEEARWAIKTSLPQGANPSSPITLENTHMPSAPDLFLNSADLAKLTVSEFSVRAVWASREQSRELSAQLATPNPAAVFHVTLPRFSEAAWQAAFHAAPLDEKPTELGFLLGKRYDDERIPVPVSVGSTSVREGQIVAVEGYVYAIGCESDGDYHIDVTATDHADDTTCFVAEVPLPQYISDASLRSIVTRARAEGAALQPGDHIHIVGQFFYDAWHMPNTPAKLHDDPGGGRGKGHCAGTLWEVHPILSVTQI
jgi:hypothetical protein